MSAPAPIRVSYVEDEAFLLEAYDRLPGPRPAAQAHRVWTWVLGSLALGFMAYRVYVDLQRNDPLWWVALVAVPIMFGLVWFGILSQRALRWHYRRGLQQHFNGGSRKASVEFGEAGFVSESEDGRSKTHPWTSVPRAVLRADGCFVFIDATTSFWFPKRVFASVDDFRRLGTLLARQVTKVERIGP
jgi:hypothetical protein